jgi:hypothetical protein
MLSVALLAEDVRTIAVTIAVKAAAGSELLTARLRGKSDE